MSVRMEPFEVHDLRDMEVQERHARLVPQLFAQAGLLGLQNLLRRPWSWTAWAENGRPVAACGILHDGGAWAFLAPDCRRYMLEITRGAQKVLTNYAQVVGPVYADIDPAYENAVRWARAIGFRPDGERWTFDGQ